MFKKLIHNIKNFVLDFLFPQKCVGCGSEDSPSTDGLCKQCAGKIDYGQSPFAYLFCASDYQDKIIKQAIWLLKYKKAKQIAKPLAELLYSRYSKRHLNFTEKTRQNWTIIPIPLHKKRLRERGFNQSEIIAKHLSVMMSINLSTDVLYKKFHTDSQVSVKDRAKRMENIKGSFAVKNPELCRNKNFILVDDVCTTGATISEARKILKEAGAKKIIALVVAKG